MGRGALRGHIISFLSRGLHGTTDFDLYLSNIKPPERNPRIVYLPPTTLPPQPRHPRGPAKARPEATTTIRTTKAPQPERELSARELRVQRDREIREKRRQAKEKAKEDAARSREQRKHAKEQL